jgi:hypothetical protein
MKLSPGEKLILLALASQQDGKEELDLGFIRKAILSGQTWALTWDLSGISTEDTSPEIADETASILSMWSYIEQCAERLGPEAKAELEKAAYPFKVQFGGFDGNNDPHHSVAHFLIEEMGRFAEFKDRALNSHSSSNLPHYRRMLPLYQEALREKGFGGQPLSAEQIAGVVKGGRD